MRKVRDIQERSNKIHLQAFKGRVKSLRQPSYCISREHRSRSSSQISTAIDLTLPQPIWICCKQANKLRNLAGNGASLTLEYDTAIDRRH